MDALEQWVYRVPESPKQMRTKPMQILALGMSRSGTESLSRALRRLGYDPVFHGFHMWQSTPMLWKPWTMLGRKKWGTKGTVEGDPGLCREHFDALPGDSEVITDSPGTLFARELIPAYPEAKVILNRRDVDAWHRSMCTVMTPPSTGLVYHVLPWFNADLYWERRYIDECLWPFFYGSWVRHGKWAYEDHSAIIRGSVEPDRLLEWTVQEGWEPLCRFLDKEVPEEEFPSGNLPDNVQKSFHEKKHVAVHFSSSVQLQCDGSLCRGISSLCGGTESRGLAVASEGGLAGMFPTVGTVIHILLF